MVNFFHIKLWYCNPLCFTLDFSAQKSLGEYWTHEINMVKIYYCENKQYMYIIGQYKIHLFVRVLETERKASLWQVFPSYFMGSTNNFFIQHLFYLSSQITYWLDKFLLNTVTDRNIVFLVPLSYFFIIV